MKGGSSRTDIRTTGIEQLLGDMALLADGAYRGHPSLLARPARNQLVFSDQLASAISADRSAVERAFGRAKATFKAAAMRSRHHNDRTIARMMVVIAALHNRLYRKRMFAAAADDSDADLGTDSDT